MSSLPRVSLSLVVSASLLVSLGGGIARSQQMPADRAAVTMENLASAKGPKMKTARMRHTNVVLADGRVILFGGVVPEFVPTRTAEIWSPASNRFSRMKMKYTHDSSALAMLQDGRYLLAGGATERGVPAYDTAQIFDPATTRFAATKGRLNHRRHGAAAATLANGDVLVAGGWYDSTSAAIAEVYRPATGRFATTGMLNSPRAYPLVLPTSDGKAVLIGGQAAFGGSFIGSVEEYDPARNAFSVLRTHLFGAETGWYVTDAFDRVVDAHQLSNGRYVYLAFKQEGGISRQALFTFDPVAKTFTRLTTTPALPDSPTVYLFQPVIDALSQRAYLLGVLVGTEPHQVRLYVVDLVTGAVTTPFGTERMPASTYVDGAAMALLQDGRLLLTGGHSEPGARTNFSAIKTTRIWQVR